MKKGLRIISLILAVFLLTSVFVSAASFPDTLYAGYKGNSSDIFVITNPPKDKSATFDKSYIVSGYGKEGATVVIYALKDGVYKKTNYNWKIGASGLFFKKINLDKGKNSYLLVAKTETGGEQTAYLEITYLGSGISDALKGMSININGLF